MTWRGQQDRPPTGDQIAPRGGITAIAADPSGGIRPHPNETSARWQDADAEPFAGSWRSLRPSEHANQSSQG